MKLFTVIVSFSSHRNGIGQFEAVSARDALLRFIKESKSLKALDRGFVESTLQTNPLLELKDDKGIWLILLDPEKTIRYDWPDDDALLGGFVIQTDPD